MKRALVATVMLVMAALPAAPVSAHDCPCFPPGSWETVELPLAMSELSPEVATAVPGGVLVFGRTAEGAELDGALLMLPDLRDGSSSDAPMLMPIDFQPLPDSFPRFVIGSASSNDVLIGGNVADPEGPSQPFFQFSDDGGRTWKAIPSGTSGLDVLLDGDSHGDGYALSGAVDMDGSFRPAMTTWDGNEFGPVRQLRGAEGFGINIASSPGTDALTIGGIIQNDKGKTRPVVFTVDEDGVQRSNLPGSRDDFPIDVLSQGDHVIVTTDSGRVLHRTDPSGKWTAIKSLRGSRILPLTGGDDAPWGAFGPGGASYSFDGGESWANTTPDGLADAGTVKAVGTLQEGALWAFSRSPEGTAQLFVTSEPALHPAADDLSFDQGADLSRGAPIDPLVDFAQMMARFFVEDLYASADGAPKPGFVDAVTDAMVDVPLENADQMPESGAAIGSAQRFAEDFVRRLAVAGGSDPTEDFIFMATGAIRSEYDSRIAVGDDEVGSDE